MHGLIAIIAAFLMVIGSAATAEAANINTFKRRELRHWTWYGPAGWVAAEGANDIYISSPTGTQYLHYGASAAPCSYPPYYNSVGGFFAYVRNSYKATARQNFGLYSRGLTGAAYTQVGPIRRIRANYYRQTANFIGRNAGRVIRGELAVDFFYVGSGACGERQQVRSAPNVGFNQSITTLRQVQSLIYGPR